MESFRRLDRNIFKKDIWVWTLICDQQNCSSLVKYLKPYFLRYSNLKPIIRSTENGEKNTHIRLLPTISKDKIMGLFSDNQRVLIKQIVQQEISLSYDNLLAKEVLQEVLPKIKDQGCPSSFETVGHIAHLNLREEYLPFKFIIGQVLLDKNEQIKTVVNKTDSISNQFRTFPMELLAGDDRFEVVLKEHGCTFAFNFRDVYWNSKLQEEHVKLVDLITKTVPDGRDLVVADIFAGVGPFAVPLLKTKGIRVYASDLNPKSYKALKKNITLNKFINPSMVSCFNLDAKEFIQSKILTGEVRPDHVIMNLPESSISFLRYFRSEDVASMTWCLRIHCYCFSTAEEYYKDIKSRVEEEIEADIDDFQVRFIRNVSSNKSMYCIHMTLDERIVYRTRKKKLKV